MANRLNWAIGITRSGGTGARLVSVFRELFAEVQSKHESGMGRSAHSPWNDGERHPMAVVKDLHMLSDCGFGHPR